MARVCVYSTATHRSQENMLRPIYTRLTQLENISHYRRLHMGECVDDERAYTQGVVAKHTETQNRKRHNFNRTRIVFNPI